MSTSTSARVASRTNRSLHREARPLLGVALDEEALQARRLAIFLLEQEIKWRSQLYLASSKHSAHTYSNPASLLTTSIMSTLSLRDEAAKFADDVVNHYTSLKQARAARTDIWKKVEACTFHSVHWHTFEPGPIDSATVLEKLDADIKDKETALAAAREGLQAALRRMRQSEKILWWHSCERLFSSIEPLVQYEPVAMGPINENAAEVADDEKEEREREAIRVDREPVEKL
ncbi:hypothetical protein SVAN01_03269 [Stagonosporopsis vannaccii]|nr:hypothetical protein SVAN01_03269 [Stagonosporopsis vannaccii]